MSYDNEQTLVVVHEMVYMSSSNLNVSEIYLASLYGVYYFTMCVYYEPMAFMLDFIGPSYIWFQEK